MMVLERTLASTVDQYLDAQHERFAAVGKQLFEVFGYDARSQNLSSQIRNLQQVVYSAVRFADIEDFVKNQMGKTGGNKWRQIGPVILDQLCTLRAEAQARTEDPSQQMAARLRLARGWARALVSEYLYRVALRQMEGQT